MVELQLVDSCIFDEGERLGRLGLKEGLVLVVVGLFPLFFKQ